MADTFSRSVQFFVDMAKEDAEAVVKTTAIKILGRLIDMSPVGNPSEWKINASRMEVRRLNSMRRQMSMYSYTNKQGVRKFRPGRKLKEQKLIAPAGYVGGRFKGNWQCGIDYSPDGETGRIDRSGERTLNIGATALMRFRIGAKSIFFVNNVPYANRLEFGHSKQAPRGMIRVTAQNFNQIFNEAVREVRRG
ncbi:TPA: hypothetical protein JHK28_000140 [Enterobacter cloacae]|nr:hypothetical protein [Enterobacter cloacae]